MLQWHSTNLNYKIRFKLNADGERIWRGYWQPFSGGKDPLEMIPADAEGWREEQLWQFANVFGPHFENGFHVPVETAVQIKCESRQILRYEVEVNLGRRGAAPIWYPMIEGEGGPSASWTSLAELKAEAADQQWDSFRIVAVGDDGSRTVIE